MYLIVAKVSECLAHAHKCYLILLNARKM